MKILPTKWNKMEWHFKKVIFLRKLIKIEMTFLAKSKALIGWILQKRWKSGILIFSNIYKNLDSINVHQTDRCTKWIFLKCIWHRVPILYSFTRKRVHFLFFSSTSFWLYSVYSMYSLYSKMYSFVLFFVLFFVFRHKIALNHTKHF